MNLIVTHAFSTYSVGDQITDAEKIAEILDGEQAMNVVKVSPPADVPAPPAKPKK